MRGLAHVEDPNLMVGSASSDDAAVYRLSPTQALVQTLDFFTPIVDDPYQYGQIAAANSLSDVYAMGGRPVTAMNIVAVPTDELPLETVNAILRGGADKVAEAGCVLAGGHTVQNAEPLYGLSVTGLVHPDKVISNAGGRAGDLLLLTKPLGTGILSTAVKRGLPIGDLEEKAARLMATLNTPGTPVAEAGLTICGTDVTGFGLLGHLLGICRESGLTAHLEASSIPAIDDQVLSLIEEDCVPGGTRKNLATAEPHLSFGAQVSPALRLLLADAQTSGGLLLAIAPEKLAQAEDLLQEAGAPIVARIGSLQARQEKEIVVS
ncbi:selenide, water dikinase SelD [Roseibacillus ishigakijimensis]|uniref:Selenide, water dikinase SelD n=1 Tax=Roseibacillus ishigakijimensis TaxID=454146 RepID=A0A934VNM4_9BACT|nr:selenide, water dikinase SelD [Roseibacillus ishigakijimensis]